MKRSPPCAIIGISGDFTQSRGGHTTNLLLLLETWRKQGDRLYQKREGKRVAAALQNILSELEPRVGFLKIDTSNQTPRDVVTTQQAWEARARLGVDSPHEQGSRNMSVPEDSSRDTTLSEQSCTGKGKQANGNKTNKQSGSQRRASSPLTPSFESPLAIITHTLDQSSNPRARIRASSAAASLLGTATPPSRPEVLVRVHTWYKRWSIWYTQDKMSLEGHRLLGS